MDSEQNKSAGSFTLSKYEIRHPDLKWLQFICAANLLMVEVWAINIHE